MTLNPVTCVLLFVPAVALCIAATPAFAATPGPAPAHVQQEVAAAVSSRESPPASTVRAGNSDFSARADGGLVTIPRDPSDPATVESGDVSIAVDLPTGDPAATRVGSTVVYDSDAGSSAVAVQAIPDGLRALVTIDDSSAPHDFPFPLSGDVARVDGEADGGLTLYDASGSVIGSVDAPWATDANGSPVPTHFSVEGTTVTQVVAFDDSSAYPVVADPAVHLHWTTFTLEFYPSDQRAIVAALRGGGAAGVAAAVCSLFGPEATVVCGVVVGAVAALVGKEIADHYHPHCHVNISLHYTGHFDRVWTSKCA
jgi:hypothetical protein